MFFPIFTLVSLLSSAASAPRAIVTVDHVARTVKVCSVRPLIQGSGTVRTCDYVVMP